MNRKVLNLTLLTITTTAVLPALAQQANTGTSSVQLYGIVDAAVRHTSNHGKMQLLGGGMSQSRFGINVTEDLGGGSKALATLEHRFNADTGEKDATAPFFQLSYVGLQGPYGRLTAGRQWNVLFDLVTSTYASFPYSPYMEVYKPEIGFAVGARTNNMLKYTVEKGNVRAGLQYSFHEAGTDSKTAGGYLRYAANGLAIGTAYMATTLRGGTRVDAWTLGSSYRTGPWYFKVSYALNKRKNDLTPVSAALINAYWNNTSNGGFLPGNASKRQMYQIGGGYQITPQLNLSAYYYHAKQSGDPSGSFNNKANFMVAVLDYAFSKRTDAYVGVDHTRVRGGDGSYIEKIGNDLVRSRTGITIGMRHRF